MFADLEFLGKTASRGRGRGHETLHNREGGVARPTCGWVAERQESDPTASTLVEIVQSSGWFSGENLYPPNSKLAANPSLTMAEFQ
jgi:hypothetical protein